MLKTRVKNDGERIATLELENKRLRKDIQDAENRLIVQESKNKALVIERTFWVEQGRALQNQLQAWQKMHADLFEQLGKGVVTEQTLERNLALASSELRQPIAVVESVNAAFAMLKENTQGRYTSISRGGSREKLEWDDDKDIRR